MAANEKNDSVFEIGAYDALGAKEVDGMKGRLMLGKALGLTGCEISANSLPAGAGVPFVHSHKLNEEVYIVLSGNGTFYADGKEFPIKEGSAIHVQPEAGRSIKAGSETLVYICIQAQKDSLTQATMDDGVISDVKASWMK